MKRWTWLCAATVVSTVAVLEAAPPERMPRASAGGNRTAVAEALVKTQVEEPLARRPSQGHRFSRAMIRHGAVHTYRTEIVTPPSDDTPLVQYRLYERSRRAPNAAERLVAMGYVDTARNAVSVYAGMGPWRGAMFVSAQQFAGASRGLRFVR